MKRLYWLCQGLGWTAYSCFYFYTNSVGYIDNPYRALLYCAALIAGGIALTTGYRALLLRLHWLLLPLKSLLPRVLWAVIGMSAAMTALNLFIEEKTFPQFVQDITPILLVRDGGAWLELFLVYTFVYHLYIYYQRSITAERARAGAELEALRSQIHPHFYFNTLNNLYGLALERSPKTEEAILRLAGIMEYVIYDCRSERVDLQRELGFIKSYVELEKLRCEPEADIRFETDVPEQSGLQIAPLLLIPFVENAFKHGSIRHEGNAGLFIRAWLQDACFCFEVVNDARPVADKKPGLGLDNVRKRLAHLYPGNHRLSAGYTDPTFNVYLSIPIACLSNA
jgi:hypothetical protein